MESNVWVSLSRCILQAPAVAEAADQFLLFTSPHNRPVPICVCAWDPSPGVGFKRKQDLVGPTKQIGLPFTIFYQHRYFDDPLPFCRLASELPFWQWCFVNCYT